MENSRKMVEEERVEKDVFICFCLIISFYSTFFFFFFTIIFFFFGVTFKRLIADNFVSNF